MGRRQIIERRRTHDKEGEGNMARQSVADMNKTKKKKGGQSEK